MLPIWCCLAWSKATAAAALVSAFVGQAAGLISWFIAASIQGGKVNVDTLGTVYLFKTFVSAYIHTAFIYVILCIFCFEVYRNNKELGSADEMWTRLSAIVKYTKIDCTAIGFDPTT